MNRFRTPEIILIVLSILGIVLFSQMEFRPQQKIPLKSDSISTDINQHKALQNELEKQLQKKNRFGFNGCLLVGWDNQIIYEGYKGYADYADRDSVSPTTRFQIGSVTKQFTAVAILQLYAKGKLNLQDSISKYFPDIPYQGFTIHQLLVHRSGLSNYIYFIDKLVEDKQITFTNTEVIELWKKYKPIPYYPPNRRFDYSNSGYMLLASVVEKVSGMSYPEYLQKHIFEPLGMNESFVLIAGRNGTLPNLAEGYKYRWKVVTEPYLNGTYGDKGIYATARDMFKWDQGLYSGKILPVDTLELAFKPMGKPIHYQHNYGYGWRMFNYKDQKVLYHAGWWQGFKSLVIRVPEHKLTIIVLKNMKTGTMFGRRELLRFILDNYLNAPREAFITDLPQFRFCKKPDPLT